MNCEQAETFLAAHVFGGLRAPLLDELREHLEACETCSARVRDMKAAAGLLEEALAAAEQPALSEDRRAKLAKLKWPKGKKKARSARRRWLFSPAFSRYFLAAAAGVTLAVLLAGLFLPSLGKERSEAPAAKHAVSDWRQIAGGTPLIEQARTSTSGLARPAPGGTADIGGETVASVDRSASMAQRGARTGERQTLSNWGRFSGGDGRATPPARYAYAGEVHERTSRTKDRGWSTNGTEHDDVTRGRLFAQLEGGNGRKSAEAAAGPATGYDRPKTTVVAELSRPSKPATTRTPEDEMKRVKVVDGTLDALKRELTKPAPALEIWVGGGGDPGPAGNAGAGTRFRVPAPDIKALREARARRFGGKTSLGPDNWDETRKRRAGDAVRARGARASREHRERLADYYYTAAKKRVDERRYEEAENNLEAALAAVPKNKEAKALLSRLRRVLQKGETGQPSTVDMATMNRRIWRSYAVAGMRENIAEAKELLGEKKFGAALRKLRAAESSAKVLSTHVDVRRELTDIKSLSDNAQAARDKALKDGEEARLDTAVKLAEREQERLGGLRQQRIDRLLHDALKTAQDQPPTVTAEPGPGDRDRSVVAALGTLDRLTPPDAGRGGPPAEKPPEYERSVLDTNGEGSPPKTESPAKTDPRGEPVDRKPDERDDQKSRGDGRKKPVKAVRVNPFVLTRRDNRSTFALETDTGSYTRTRSYIRRNLLPPKHVVRVEEFVNWFDYNYSGNVQKTFSVQSVCARSPFRPGVYLLKIGVKAKRVGRDGRRPNNLVLCIDTSSSMGTPDRLPLAQTAATTLVNALSPSDRVSVVVYGTKARLVLDATPIKGNRRRINSVINSLRTGGSTNVTGGLAVAYQQAQRGFRSGQNNVVLLISDGIANVGPADAKEILRNVRLDRRQGIGLTSVGVGTGQYNDRLMEQLANKGDGRYIFVDTREEARRVFVQELAQLQVVARDARIQVEFDPRVVRRYRLLGYENRDIADRDFRNDAIDAGEIGSGQSATALYELELLTTRRPIGIVRVRYRNAETNDIEEIASRIRAEHILRPGAKTPPRLRLAACAAQFAELLRGSEYARNGTLSQIEAIMSEVCAELPLDDKAAELHRLVRDARGLPRGK